VEAIRRIDHIVALVPDAAEAARTYREALGFPVAWSLSNGDGWRSAAAWLGDASLELLEPQGQPFFERARERHGLGLFMLAFEPGPIEAAVSALNQRGVQVTDPVTSSVSNAALREDQRGYRTAFISRRSTPGLNAFLCEYDSPFTPMEGGGGALKVKKLDHVIIATEDLEDAKQLWEKNIGLKEDKSMDHPLGAGFKVARLPIGQAFLELVQPVAREGRFYEQFQQRGEGMFSISVEVEDLDEAVAFLKGKDIKVSEPEPSIWPGARLARINHEYTHGVSIQLIERK
jgi:catechol 2,3-dioxygenase-like lactoylglutathione lyase family enzyme